MYTAILLAAGRSSRMGQPKGLLDWKGRPLILHQIQQLQLSRVNKIVIVLGYEPKNYLPYVKDDQITVLRNENWASGKCSSILKGLTMIESSCEGFLFVNLDQPVSFDVVNHLIDSYERTHGLIHIPVFNQKKGHPIFFSTRLLPVLRTVNEETQGIKNVIRTYQDEIIFVNLADSSILYNFNTPSDYRGGIKQ